MSLLLRWFRLVSQKISDKKTGRKHQGQKSGCRVAGIHQILAWSGILGYCLCPSECCRYTPLHPDVCVCVCKCCFFFSEYLADCHLLLEFITFTGLHVSASAFVDLAWHVMSFLSHFTSLSLVQDILFACFLVHQFCPFCFVLFKIPNMQSSSSPVLVMYSKEPLRITLHHCHKFSKVILYCS